ncbi:HET-domain-containing protein, partial [Periconia macrospinosa]
GLYEALPTKSHVRVLSFHLPIDDKLPIQCTLRPARLEDEDLVFQALSYTWGDPFFRHWNEKPLPHAAPVPIICNGVEVGITANLDAALRAILKRPLGNEDPEQEKQYLWIDSLCINQEDIQERNAQVAMMSQIYGRASLVISWLGPADADSEVAIPLMHRLLSLQDTATEAGDTILQDGFSTEGMQEVVPIPETQYGSLARFLARRYFFRCWVLQEVVLAPALLILCGSTTLYIEELRRVALVVQSLREKHMYDPIGQALVLPSRLRFSFQHEQAILELCEHRVRKHCARPEANRFAFHQLLGLTRMSGCFDPRDKVYSMLGMVPKHAFGIEPDYSKSVEEVYSEAIRLWINETRCLNILSWVADKKSRTFPHFPSWVGEFNVNTNQQMLAFTTTLHTATLNSMSAPVEIDPKDFRALHVRGVQIDSIVELAQPWGWHGLGVGFDPLWTSMTLRLPPVYPTGQTRGEALIYTFIANEVNFRPVDEQADMQAFRDIVRRDTSFALIRQLHRVCWFTDLPDTGPSYNAAALPILRNLDSLAQTDLSGFIPSLSEVHSMEAATCSCAASLSHFDPNEPLINRDTRNGHCLYFEEVSSLARYDINDTSDMPPSGPNVPDANEWDSRFSGAMNQKMRHRRVARTEKGFLGLVADSAEVGDAVWLLQGARVPFVLRQVLGDAEAEKWEVVGDAYVHGAMRGEVWKE